MASTLPVVDSGWMHQGHHYIAYAVMISSLVLRMASLIASCMGPTWGPSGADRTQVGPMLAPWTLISGMISQHVNTLRPRQNIELFAITFANVFSWIKVCEFWLISHLSWFLTVQLAIFSHWFRLWLGTHQATSQYLNHWWKIFWRIYASLGLNECTNA